jgi:hypothetical protein
VQRSQGRSDRHEVYHSFDVLALGVSLRDMQPRSVILRHQEHGTEILHFVKGGGQDRAPTEWTQGD